MRVSQETLESLLKEATKESHITNTNFLQYIKEERGLKRPPNWGYVPYYKLEDGTIVSSSIIFPIRNVMGTLVAIETRSILHKDFHKLYSNKARIPIYNIQNIKGNTVILTEAIICAETIIQESCNMPVVSLLKAQTADKYLHYLASMFDNIIVAYDNDETGQNSWERIEKFFSMHYPEIEIDYLDYISEDINQLYTEDKKLFRKTVINQLEIMIGET